MSNTSYRQYEWSSSPGDSRITWAVQTLILANVITFAAQLVIDIPFGGPRLGIPGAAVAEWLGLHFQASEVARGYLWQPFTYMFLHGGLMHLAGNMLWLYFFGPDVERILGSRQFCWFYVICGAAGVLINFAPIMTLQTNTVVGASGAVMGVLVAYAMTNPERQFFFFPFPFPINARAMVAIVVAMNIVSALSGTTTSVATHFGGMAVGAAYMKYVPVLRAWQAKRERAARPKSEPDDKIGEAVDNIFKFDSKKSRRK
ncbi:MAG: rhomboid family intramembrane serine protease [Candidatus Hydrogenedentes bacterium]|nr:rhomboid family intramembrane serine protease [Candidatus Hydrogenedentota bacterium]